MKRRILKIVHDQKSVLSVCVLVVFLTVLCFVSVSTVKPASSVEQEDVSGTEDGGQDEIHSVSTGNKELSEAEDVQTKGSRELLKAEDTQDSETDSEETRAAMSLDEAVGQAVLFYNEDQYWPANECTAEGHMILGDERDGDSQVTVYALTMFGGYEFHDGFFVKESGTGVIPVVMDFSYDDREGYVLQNYQQPMDGGYYIESLKEMFPKQLWETCLSPGDEMLSQLERQERNGAKQYLKKIGREAQVGDYVDHEHPLLTDAGVSVEVSNQLCELERQGFWKYPSWIGNRELIEDGVRYVYEMMLDKKAGEIIYAKSVYDTGERIEEFRVDMYTGKILSDTEKKDF